MLIVTNKFRRYLLQGGLTVQAIVESSTVEDALYVLCRIAQLPKASSGRDQALRQVHLAMNNDTPCFRELLITDLSDLSIKDASDVVGSGHHKQVMDEYKTRLLKKHPDLIIMLLSQASSAIPDENDKCARAMVISGVVKGQCTLCPYACPLHALYPSIHVDEFENSHASGNVEFHSSLISGE